ncbi:hypothetical protein RYO59_002117 [Thermosynechococcaceae cyanobacterium Okahandja]
MVALILLVMFAIESAHPTRDVTMTIHLGMPRDQVVETLGVMYDYARVREYPSADAITALMDNRERITSVASWRVAYSLSRFWVGFDEEDRVVATLTR